MIRVSIDSKELARVLGNALAFLPAKSQIKHAQINLTLRRIYTVGSDGYAAGTDWANLNSSEGLQDTVTPILVDREGLTALEGVARRAKKSEAALAFSGSNLTLFAGEEVVDVPTYEDEHSTELLEAVTGYLHNIEGRPPVIPGIICLDPSLFTRFGKVKADSSSRMADLYMTDDYSPVLVKIGPTFKGLVMPIEREQHARNNGEDGLW